MKTIRYVLVLLLITSFAVSCGDDDTPEIDTTGVTPTNISLDFSIAQDNSGLVTITPSAESANSFTIFFGDGTGESADVALGSSVDRTYPEGSFDVRVVARSVTGETAEATQPLMVSFSPPENLVVTIGEVEGDPFSRTVSATADFATMFNVFFGDEENEEPTVLMIDETITQTYTTPGEFVIRVVAIGGGAATVEESTTVTISSAIATILDFEGDSSGLGFEGFEGADSAIEDNPDPSGINTSATVLRSTKTDGAQFFAGTLINLDEAIDFSQGEAIVINTFSPKADIPIRVAIENQDTGNQIFVDVNTTVINEWEELVFDFSGLLDPSVSYNRIVIFFEFIVDLPGDGSIYFVDNIGLTEGSGDDGGDTEGQVALPLDFEMDLQFNFEGFEGTDSAIEANPDPSGINTSATVLRSTKTEGAQFFAGTFLNLDQPIDFSTMEGIAIDTYSPKADIPIRVRLENADNSSGIELDMNTTATNQWETLVYDFSSMINPAVDYVRIIVFFEFIPELPGDGSTYFYDNARLADVGGGNTGEAVVLPVDFESTTLVYDILGFEGAESAIEANPFQTGINTSSTVLRSTKTMGAQFFAGTLFNLDAPIDFSSGQSIQITTYSPKANIPIRVRLENADNSVGIELDAMTTVANEWEVLTYDFSSMNPSAADFVRVVVFFEFVPDLPGDGSTYYYDNLEVTSASGSGGGTADSTSFPVNFETPGTGGESTFRVFENDDNPPLEIVANPDPTGMNSSATVAQFTARANGQDFAGTETFLTTPFTLDATNSRVSVMVWKSVISDVGIQFAVGAAAQPPIRIANTVVNQWEELVFDFSENIGLVESIDITTLVIFPDFDARGQENIIFFDNITLSASDTGNGGDGGDTGSVMLINGDFEAGSAPWTIGVGSDPAPVVTQNDNTFYSVNVEAAGEVFSVNLSQTGLTIVNGTNYILTFDAWSDVDRSIVAGIGLSGGDFSNTSVPVNLSTTQQTFTLQLTAAGFGDNNSRVLFDNGGEVGMVNIDNVSLVEGGDGSDTP